MTYTIDGVPNMLKEATNLDSEVVVHELELAINRDLMVVCAV